MAASARAAVPDATSLEIPEIDALVESAISEHKLPGAVVAIGRRDGLRFLKAYGDRAIYPQREAMTTDTVFDLASLTKAVSTGTLVMQLAAAGKLDLDVPAARYLPAIAAFNRGTPTVRDLLLHGSGLPPVAPLRDYRGDVTAALAQIARIKPIAPPGQRFAYSDLGFIALGALLEQVTGQNLTQLSEQRLFAPLGMSDTRYRPDERLWPRIAPTERIDARRAALMSDADLGGAPQGHFLGGGPEGSLPHGVIRGQVHDPRAFRLGGVAGHAGVFSTARDLSRFARMLLGHGQLDGARVLPASAVDTLTTPHMLGDDVRALGWDMRTRYSGLRGKRLSAHAFGHGGFTGTSLWIDPDRDLFVIFLSNRVHPDGKGYVIPLAGAIADRAVSAMARQPPAATSCKRSSVLTGIDVLRRDGFAALRGKRVGLVVHNASRARDGVPTLALLQKAPGVTLGALFAPEHGLASNSEGALKDTSQAGLPVYSLFGKTRKPTPEMLRGLDAIVFDLQDVGVRFFTYMSTLRYILEAAAEAGIEVIVLDRPNPSGALHAEGPLLDANVETFVNYHRLPVLHGLTAGELAELLNRERKIDAKLSVVPLEGYARDMQFADTDSTWYAPSPNLPTPDAALLYPATGLLESSNLSVGRGTDYPFAFVGAPWLSGPALAAALERRGLPGVKFEPLAITPHSDRYRGQLCSGVRLSLTERHAFEPVLTGVSIAHEVLKQVGAQYRAQDIGRLLGDARALSALAQGTPPEELESLWERELLRFERVRRRYLRYAYCTSE
ncbi:MAG TPA: exo-beta-N-acetylmuramidase NamZ domain-containing protein [Polyangiales bacterium]|nr:exo-beta-N-acetylmuramidase NamZ domain-containing protein [Polyangiales bacterium]